MRVALNITSCVKAKPTGIGNYIRALLAVYASNPEGIQFQLHVRPQKFFKRDVIDGIPAPEGPIRLLMRPYPFFVGRCDVMHSLGTWLPDCKVSFRKVVTIQDISTIDDPAAAGEDWSKGRAKKIQETMSHADFVITPSEFTRGRLIERLGFPEERVRAIHLGVDTQSFLRMPTSEARSLVQGLGIDCPYLLALADSPTGKNPGASRKNSAALIRGFGVSKAREEAKLVFFGAKNGPTRAMRDAIREHGLEDRVLILSYVEREQLVALYSAASLFMFPSLYEGFGLPLLEAMALGVPAAAARTSSMPEVGGDCVSYFDPLESEDIAQCIDEIQGDPEFARSRAERGVARAQKFSWQRHASETIAVYKELAS